MSRELNERYKITGCSQQPLAKVSEQAHFQNWGHLIVTVCYENVGIIFIGYTYEYSLIISIWTNWISF